MHNVHKVSFKENLLREFLGYRQQREGSLQLVLKALRAQQESLQIENSRPKRGFVVQSPPPQNPASAFTKMRNSFCMVEILAQKSVSKRFCNAQKLYKN